MTPKYTRVWGIQVGRWNGKVSVLLNTEDDDDATATTAGLTAGSYVSDSDMDTGDEEYFAAEKFPRNPPEQLLYNVTGNSYEDERADIPKRPGRSEAGYVIPSENSLPKPGTTRSPSNAFPYNTDTQKYLPKPGTTCSPTCPPSTAGPANAATHQSSPKPSTT